MKIRALLSAVAVFAAVAPAAGAAAPSPVAQDRRVEPVVLLGSAFPSWSAGPDIAAREPQAADDSATRRSDCYTPPAEPGKGWNPYDDSDRGDHNCYQSSRAPQNPNVGADVSKLLGYRWTGDEFEQIPFQVDEKFTRYISNNVSGFAFYSGVDEETTFAFDREGFRYTWDEYLESGGDPCAPRPRPGSTVLGGYATTPDPVKGLDDNDELVFMWDDAGAQAPVRSDLPAGILSSYEVRIADPSDPASLRFVYVMLAGPGGPAPAFDASNGYVRYERDPGVRDPLDPTKWAVPPADMFAYSQSSYSNYGAAPKGPYCELDGHISTKYHGNNKPPASPPAPNGWAIEQRRPLDTAWVKTPRYWFRYDGRWLMTQLRISPDDSGLEENATLGPDIIDQWKARAFQQRPGGTTPCCGYEEEVNNWGGSSILMGERWGPVRAIRVAWGADSSTNNIKTEVFYRDEIRFRDNLRVHVIPPFDGIYVQWDYNAGKVSTYYNPWQPQGVPIDGKNDEVFGNTYWNIEDERVGIRDDDPIPVVGPQNLIVPIPGREDDGRCRIQGQSGICNDIDIVDPTFSGPLGNLNWEQVSGPFGTVVTRWTIREHTAGDAYALTATPYYRDDSCFDDGTGTDPGPHLRTRGVDNGEFAKWTNPETLETVDRVCWQPGDPITGDPSWDRRYWQGDIATHGLHLNLIAESDNAYLTKPVDEIDSEQRMVVLQGNPGNVGERYGRGTAEYPLQLSVRAML